VGVDLLRFGFFLFFFLFLLGGVRDEFTDDFRNFVEGPVVDVHSIGFNQVKENCGTYVSCTPCTGRTRWCRNLSALLQTRGTAAWPTGRAPAIAAMLPIVCSPRRKNSIP
jgi:hypothetical protein